MTDNTKDMILSNLTPENIQKYILGTKKNGNPRAIYDVVRDYTLPEKRRKKRKHKMSTYGLYLETKKRKKHKKNKRKEYWHI